MSIFTKNQKIQVRVFFIDNNVSIRFLEANEAKEMIEKREKGETTDVVNVLNTVWKNLSWKENTEVINDSRIVSAVGGEPDFNVYKYREHRLKKCLVEWDLKDDKGVVIPITADVVDSLDADFAVGLLNAFDQKRVGGSDPEKK